MIVRTYGRRNRSLTRTYSDSIEEEDDAVPDHSFRDSFSLSQEKPSQDLYSLPFSSQESSSLWPSLNHHDPYQEIEDFSNGFDSRRLKKPRIAKFERPSSKISDNCNSSSLVPVTSTLMETQEFGEMMEHVDEVNFAIDGLRKGQPIRIKRASLLSLLSICGTVQQRRLLRAQGLAKTIIDAILGLNFDDSSCSLAAATLFYVLTGDGQDDHLLESPSFVLFLIKLLKPVTSSASGDKAPNIGSKLLALRKDSDFLKMAKQVESTSASIVAKVEEILVSCKDIKPCNGDASGVERPELSPKWIALLTMEKACLSKISFEDTSGMVRKAGCNFKEKLRELGGLDAVFDVAANCHSAMESWSRHGSHTIQDVKDDSRLQNLMVLLKCLKIIENATFLSNDNQSHLLGIKGHSDSYGCRLSFTKLILSVIKILSGCYLLKSAMDSGCRKPCSLSDGSYRTCDLVLTGEDTVNSNGIISISSSTNLCGSEKSSSGMGSSNPNALMNDSCTLGMRIRTSTSSSYSGRTARSCDGGTPSTSNGSGIKFGLPKRTNSTKLSKDDLIENSLDPYAFDEDEFQPSKWELLSGKPTKSRSQNPFVTSTIVQNRHHYELMSLEESSNGDSLQKSKNVEKHPRKNFSSNDDTEEHYNLMAECLLTAVKVLMNLTNDNPIGCKQIANCGGLETVSSLIAGHFPSFSSSLSFFNEIKEDSSSIELDTENDNHLTDRELDFLVAILGLLVNLVEKDGHNRSRLAATTISIPSSEGLNEARGRDIIPLLCSIFLANQGAADASGEGSAEGWNDEAAVLQGEKEAEKMIVEAYAALLLAFLSTESKSIRDSIANCLPNQSLAVLVPVLERFVAFHLTLNMISPETHKAVSEVIESCRIP